MKKDNIIALFFGTFSLPIIFIWFLPLLCSPVRYNNREIINRYKSQYYKYTSVLAEISLCLAEANIPEKIYLHYRVNNQRHFDVVMRYSYLLDKSCLQNNIYFFSDYFCNVGCYQDLVWFSRGDRNINNNGCSLEKCSDLEKYYPNCTVYSGSNYPKDTDTNCMYHIEGDWYVRVP